MRLFAVSLPQGWPWSLWFFIATAVVYLLQRFPYTGIFLMIAAAAIWSVVLVNLGFVGIAYEALSGRVSRLWLVLPLLYFGGYYLVRTIELARLSQMSAELARGNAGTSVAFDPSSQDLVIETGTGNFHPSASDVVRRYGLRRAFEGKNVHFIGDRNACALVRANEVYRSAGIYGFGFFSPGSVGSRRMVEGYCSIYAPAQPDRPVVRVKSDQRVEQLGTLPLQVNQFRIRDEASGQEVEVRAASAEPLKPFPMPAMGCALNSGAPSWDCFAGFMRSRSVSLNIPYDNDTGATGVIAAALGLKRSDDYAAIAAGVDVVRAYGATADAKLIDKEMKIVEGLLTEPTRAQKDSWLFHLPNRPDVIVPLAGRIFAALGTLQASNARTSENGRNLWRLAAALPDTTLAQHRAQMVEWLGAANARPWTEDTGEIYARLDGADPAEREIILRRLETRRGDLDDKLLRSFCRMGAGAPDDAKQRLLALWHARAPGAGKRESERKRDDVPLYFTLARIGLKEQAGHVQQRFYGPTFEAIWSEVTPDFPDVLCTGSLNDITNRFRKR